MGRLIVSDFKKLIRCRALWVCAVIGFLTGMLMTVLYDMAWKNMEDSANYQMVLSFFAQAGMDADTSKQLLSQFPKEVFWQYINILLSDGSIPIFAAIVISVFVGAEYHEGTMKNTLSRGFSRQSVYLSKYLACVGAMAITVLSYVLGGGIVAAVKFDLTTDVSEEQMAVMLLAYTALLLALTGVLMLIAVLSKRTGLSIAVSLVVPIIVSVVVRILTVGFDWVTKAVKYWLFDTQTMVGTLYESGDIAIAFIVAGIYLTVSLVLGILVFRRQEIR